MYNIQTVIFKREQTSNMEPGLLLNEGELIIDLECKPVTQIYDYQRLPSYLSIGTEGIFKEINERFCIITI